MNKRFDWAEAACWALGALPLAAALAAKPFLPERIPIHWGMDGQIDGWGGFGQVLLVAALGLGVTALLKFLPRIDPKRKNYDKFAGGYRALRLTFGVFYCFTTGTMLAAGLWPDSFAKLDIGTLTTMSVGILFCVMGNFMPQFKHNYFCGIKTPWALADEENWRRTHRFAGPMWFWGGLAVALCGIVLRGRMLAGAMAALLTACVAVPYVYSYLIFKKSPKT